MDEITRRRLTAVCPTDLRHLLPDLFARGVDFDTGRRGLQRALAETKSREVLAAITGQPLTAAELRAAVRAACLEGLPPTEEAAEQEAIRRVLTAGG